MPINLIGIEAKNVSEREVVDGFRDLKLRVEPLSSVR